MTIAPEKLAPPEHEAPAEDSVVSQAGQPSSGIGAGQPALSVRIGAVTLAGALSTAATAWLGGALIKGMVPRLIAFLGVAIGAGLSYVAFRVGRPALQYGIIPIAGIAGTVLIAPEAKGGSANLPSLVVEAIRGGGLLQPPIAFDPGWRFILVVFFAVVSSAAVAVAVATQKPKLAVMIPLPLLIGAALLQPESQAVAASAVAVFFFIGALAVAFGARATSEETRDLNRTFELRRLLRGAAMLALVLVGLVALSQTSFLFPSSKSVRIIPPRRPPDVPLEKDRQLFVVHASQRGPFRLGVLDSYDGEAWLLPAEDPGRLVAFRNSRVPPALVPAKQRGTAERRTEFEIADMKGLFLPVPSGLVGVQDVDAAIKYDPTTGVPRLERRLPQGLRYTALTAPLPLASQLNAAPDPPAAIAELYTRLPPAPPDVVRLLSSAPSERFTRIQFLRDKLYGSVTLSGGGGPKPIPARRVAEMLKRGTLADPYEVAAAETMLARWAGIPARIGYGYYGGDAVEGGYSFRPRHGRVWLETYFEGYGWVPLVGTPPRAASSLSSNTKLQDPNVRPSEDLAMVVFVPVRERSLVQLFEIIRYWFLVALLCVAIAVALVGAYPMFLKALRSARRRRWQTGRGRLGQVLVSYAEFRDRCNDMNLGAVQDSPLVFAERFGPDDEHDEVAWLVTRLFWGDLRRDPRDDDVKAALRMIDSVERRILRAQSPTNRLLGSTSRASLRDPFSEDIPNLYPRPLLRLRDAFRAVRRPLGIVRRFRKATRATAMTLVILLIGSCASRSGLGQANVPATLPPNIPPQGVLGLRFVREPVAEKEYVAAGSAALVQTGRVYSIHEGTTIQGDLQVSVFKTDVDATDRDVRSEIEEAIGGSFQTDRFGTVRLRYATRGEQRLYLWFPPERNAMLLLVMRAQYAHPEELIRRIVASVRGLDLSRLLSLQSWVAS